MALALAPVVLVSVERMSRPRTRHEAHFAARVHRWRFAILVLGLFFVYLAAPVRIKVTTLVYQRFLPPAWAILAISSAAGTRGTSRLLHRSLCVALPVASLLITWPTFVDSHRVYSDLEVLMSHMDPGSSVLSASYTASQERRLWNPAVIDGYVVAAHGGRSVNDYTQSPISILAQRPEKQWIEAHARLRKRHFDLRPTWDLTRFRYLIVETDSPELAMAISAALRGEARLTASQGGLSLYESTLPLVPIDADDAPLPVPPPPTLDSLVNAAFKGPRPADTLDPGRPP
jgi:hypothetical protein